MKLKTSYGIIKYSGGKCSLDIDRDFGNYYFSLIPKYYYPRRPLYQSHITIVRSRIETIKKNYGMWNNMRIPFVYLPIIRQGGKYFWIDCFSLHVGLLRQELGLSWFRPGFHSYHLTIANIK